MTVDLKREIVFAVNFTSIKIYFNFNFNFQINL